MAARHECQCRPVGQEHRPDCTDQGRNAVEPDPGARVRHPERLSGHHDRGLEPVNADGFLVADLVLEADVDEVAALDHLLGGLGKSRLVAVHRWNLKEARQERRQRDCEEERGGARMRGRDEREQPADRVGRPNGPWLFADRRHHTDFCCWPALFATTARRDEAELMPPV
jgi:hypothetical protein